MDRKTQIINCLNLGSTMVVKYDFFFEGKQKFIINEGMNVIKESILPIPRDRVVYISNYIAKILNVQTGTIDNVGHGIRKIAVNDHLIATSSDKLLQIMDFNTGRYISELIVRKKVKLFLYDKYLFRYIANIVIKTDLLMEDEVIYYKDEISYIQQLLVVNDKLICLFPRKIVIFNLYTGHLIHTHKLLNDSICMYKLDDQHIIICCSEHTELYNIITSTSQNIFEGYSGISSLHILPDKRIVTSSFESVIVWKNLHEMQFILSEHADSLMDILPNGDVLINYDDIFEIWNSDTGRFIHTFSIIGYNSIRSMTVCSDKVVIICQGKEEEIPFMRAFKKENNEIIVLQ